MKVVTTLAISLSILSLIFLARCTAGKKITEQEEIISEVIITNQDSSGLGIELQFIKGESFNHPLMAVWIEKMNGDYLQTLFIAKSLGTGVFNYGDKSEGKWKPGFIRRPAALPYWSHKRGVIEEDGLYVPTPNTPMPDAITAATPKQSFVLQSKAPQLIDRQFVLLLEINQTWDWNEYWTNNKYPEDQDYKTSCQPSLIYAVTIDLDNLKESYELVPIGHGHHSGKTGELFTDLSSITTAFSITKKIIVNLNPN